MADSEGRVPVRQPRGSLARRRVFTACCAALLVPCLLVWGLWAWSYCAGLTAHRLGLARQDHVAVARGQLLYYWSAWAPEGGDDRSGVYPQYRWSTDPDPEQFADEWFVRRQERLRRKPGFQRRVWLAGVGLTVGDLGGGHHMADLLVPLWMPGVVFAVLPAVWGAAYARRRLRRRDAAAAVAAAPVVVGVLGTGRDRSSPALPSGNAATAPQPAAAARSSPRPADSPRPTARPR